MRKVVKRSITKKQFEAILDKASQPIDKLKQDAAEK
jgi:hypothetical protein